MRKDNRIVTHTTLDDGKHFGSRVMAEEARDMIGFCNIEMPVSPDVAEIESSTTALENFHCACRPESGSVAHSPQWPPGASSLQISTASIAQTIGE